MQDHRFHFGAFTLDAQRSVLLREGLPVPLGQRATALLRALVAADGKVLTKSELIEAAWPRAVVEESNLSVQIAVLRKLLGPAPRGEDAIVTVARVGYRFALPVRAAAARPGAPLASGSAPAAIAVLPLVDLSEQRDQQYVADGIAEDLIMVLSRFRWFRVLGRSASFAFQGQRLPARDIAERLGVRYLLEGSVRRSGTQVRISLQLTDAQDGCGLWGEHYDFAPGDVFALQDAIAERVAGAIEPELLQREGSCALRRPGGSDASALDRVYRGTWLFHQVGQATHLEARELFREAARCDPGLAAAQFWLARVSAGIVAYGWSEQPEEDLREGLQAAMRAIRADERNPYAHYALAITSAYAEGELAQCVRAARRAVDLAPGFALGHLVLGMGLLYSGDAADAAKALAHGLRLNAFDPQNFVWCELLAYARLFSGDSDGALAAAREALGVRPGWAPAQVAEVCALVALGRRAHARSCAERLSRLPPVAEDPGAPMKRHNPAWAAAIRASLAQVGMSASDG